MSKKNRHRPSQEGGPNALTTEPTPQAQVEISAPIQERPMEASQEKTPEVSAEQTGPTAKQMAAAEETNQLRQIKLAQAAAEAPPEAAVPITDVAARGYDALHEAFRVHNENAKKAHREYVPPARTERQMTVLQEELEAGRRTQQRAEAQRLASLPPETDLRKEGFTTPVYRPNDVVPDPITGKMKAFGPEA